MHKWHYKWKRAEAAVYRGVTQPRINNLLRGRLSNLSRDALVNIAASIGCKVHMKLEEKLPRPQRSARSNATEHLTGGIADCSDSRALGRSGDGF
ncbi:MAG: XRE family transcriptional regulator [Candidatus Symbiodolus clandestinus]